MHFNYDSTLIQMLNWT